MDEGRRLLSYARLAVTTIELDAVSHQRLGLVIGTIRSIMEKYWR